MDGPTWATVGVAIATLVLAGVTVWLARTGWRRDDRKRLDDKEENEHLRKEDAVARDARDQLRRLAQADREACQVIVDSRHPIFPGMIILSTPCTYPIKKPELMWLDNAWSWGSPSPLELPAEVNGDRICYTFKVELSKYTQGGEPMVSFIDTNGVRYYQFRHLTLRFKQNDEWQQAVVKFRQWFSLGPGPDA